MKKAICIILAAVILAGFAGCGQANNDRSNVVNQGKTVSDVLNDGINNGGASKDGKQAPISDTQTKPSGELPLEYQKPDVDLTVLNSTMVYSEVYNMVTSPDSYLGKTVKMKGTFTYMKGDNRYYFACLIADATACCSQGIEFVLKKGGVFPDDYPRAGETITVVGIFDTYYEGESRYCQLKDAYMN